MLLPGHVVINQISAIAYRNIKQILYRTVPLVRRELDKQMTTIVLVQVIFNVIAITPCIILLLINIII